MSKSYNDKLGYMMDNQVNDKLDATVRSYQKDNEIAEEMDEEKSEDDRYPIFDAVFFDAFQKAKEMYVEDGESLDKVIDEYIKWLKSCKGKEKILLKTLEKVEESDDEDGMAEASYK
jgi:hypothetical protein